MTKFGSQNVATQFGNHLCMATKIGGQFVSSQFEHLVNTGLAVGFLVKWLPIMVAHTCKLDTIWVVYILPIGNGSIRLKLLLTHCAQCSFIANGVWHFIELIGLILWKIDLSLPWKLIFSKSYHSW